MIEKVRQIICDELGLEDVDPDLPLEDLGVDSLEFVALMQAMAEEVGEIPEEEWVELCTVRDLAEALEDGQNCQNWVVSAQNGSVGKAQEGTQAGKK